MIKKEIYRFRIIPGLFTLFIIMSLSGLRITANAQMGHVLSGVGAIDQGWSGAGTANPQDVLGALHWNPAAITHQDRSSFNVNLQMLTPNGRLYSGVKANAFGPMGPQQDLSGNTESKSGNFAIPAIAFVYQPRESDFTFGFHAFGVGGFGVDYVSTPTNPITTPQPPNGMGFNAINSEFMLMQMAPTVAYKISDMLSIAVSPVANLSTLEVNPFPATNPDDSNGDGFPSYPGGPREMAWGFGYQIGINIGDVNGLRFGASYKSNQRFEDFKFTADSENGSPRSFNFNLDYPMITSAGLGYSGFERLELAADVKYIDFEHTHGFDKVGFDQSGAVQGFGWKSIWVIAAGIQYDVTDKLPVRLGYSYNENPISDANSFYNVSAPAIIQHHLSAGFSYRINPQLTGSFAIQYGLKNSTRGEWMNPQMGGAVPNTYVKNELSTRFIALGLCYHFK